MKMAVPHFNHVIDGQRVGAPDGPSFESINPASGEPWCTVALASRDEAASAVASAAKAFTAPEWASISQTERGRMLFKLADLIDRESDRLARYETTDNGKLLREMEVQARIVPDFLRYYAGLADKIEGRSIPLERTSVLQLHAPRAPGRRSRDHALELADVPDA